MDALTEIARDAVLSVLLTGETTSMPSEWRTFVDMDGNQATLPIDQGKNVMPSPMAKLIEEANARRLHDEQYARDKQDAEDRGKRFDRRPAPLARPAVMETASALNAIEARFVAELVRLAYEPGWVEDLASADRATQIVGDVVKTALAADRQWNSPHAHALKTVAGAMVTAAAEQSSQVADAVAAQVGRHLRVSVELRRRVTARPYRLFTHFSPGPLVSRGSR